MRSIPMIQSVLLRLSLGLVITGCQTVGSVEEGAYDDGFALEEDVDGLDLDEYLEELEKSQIFSDVVSAESAENPPVGDELALGEYGQDTQIAEGGIASLEDPIQDPLAEVMQGWDLDGASGGGGSIVARSSGDGESATVDDGLATEGDGRIAVDGSDEAAVDRQNGVALQDAEALLLGEDDVGGGSLDEQANAIFERIEGTEVEDMDLHIDDSPEDADLVRSGPDSEDSTSFPDDGHPSLEQWQTVDERRKPGGKWAAFWRLEKRMKKQAAQAQAGSEDEEVPESDFVGEFFAEILNDPYENPSNNTMIAEELFEDRLTIDTDVAVLPELDSLDDILIASRDETSAIALTIVAHQINTPKSKHRTTLALTKVKPRSIPKPIEISAPKPKTAIANHNQRDGLFRSMPESSGQPNFGTPPPALTAALGPSKKKPAKRAVPTLLAPDKRSKVLRKKKPEPRAHLLASVSKVNEFENDGSHTSESVEAAASIAQRVVINPQPRAPQGFRVAEEVFQAAYGNLSPFAKPDDESAPQIEEPVDKYIYRKELAIIREDPMFAPA